MKVIVQLTLERPGGSDISIDADVYKFRPSEAYGGKHVCEVTDPRHIKRFMEIDGYVLVDPEAEAAAQKEIDKIAAADKAAAEKTAQDKLDAEAKAKQEAEDKAKAEAEAELTSGDVPPAGNPLTTEVTEGAPADGTGDDDLNTEDELNYDAMGKEELLAEIEMRGMDTPHHATGEAKLRELLRADDAERDAILTASE